MRHSIPTISISIEPTHLEVLESNVWNEEYVPSKMVAANIPYEIGITYRGDHIAISSKNRIESTLEHITRNLQGVKFTLMLNIAIPH